MCGSKRLYTQGQTPQSGSGSRCVHRVWAVRVWCPLSIWCLPGTTPWTVTVEVSFAATATGEMRSCSPPKEPAAIAPTYRGVTTCAVASPDHPLKSCDWPPKQNPTVITVAMAVAVAVAQHRRLVSRAGFRGSDSSQVFPLSSAPPKRARSMMSLVPSNEGSARQLQ